MTEQERREHYLSHGICPHCGRNDLQAGYKLCLECRMKDREYHKNRSVSAEQRAKQAAAKKELAEKRKAAGIQTAYTVGRRKLPSRGSTTAGMAVYRWNFGERGSVHGVSNLPRAGFVPSAMNILWGKRRS